MSVTRRTTQCALIFSAALTLLGSGCVVGPGRSRQVLEFEGRSRSYLLHLPPGHDTAQDWPLVIALHPFAANGEMMAQTSGFDTIADEEGFLVCYPEGVTFLWNGDPTDETKDLLVEDANDVGYISALVEHLVTEYGADPARVYLTGASNGGLMTERLACERAELFAAVAPVMITLPEGFPAWCTASMPVPMLMILGVDDPFFPWQGGLVEQGPTNTQRYLSAAETVNFWVERNNASMEPTIEALPDRDPNDGTRVVRETHAGGDSGADFIFYRVEGGGHTWPGSRLSFLESLAGVGRVSQDIDASRVIWDFFKSKSRPAEANS